MFDIVSPGTITITAPSGVDGNGEVAVLNNVADSTNFVGYGLELTRSAPIRQSKDNVPEGDGAVFGSQYYGEGSWTLSVWLRASSAATSMARRDKLFKATHAMRGDLTMVWTEGDGVQKTIAARRAQFPQGPDENGRVMIGLEGAKFYAYGANNARGTATSHTFTPTGIYETYPTVTVPSPGGTVTLARTSPSPAGTLTFTGLSGGGAVTIDFEARTITQGGVDKAGSISWPSSTWWALQPGSSNVLAFSSAGSIDWRAHY